MTIQVLGSGCPTCKKLLETVKKITAELKIDAAVEYITDAAKIAELGVMSSPVLAIDGRPVLSGGGHSEAEIKEAIGGHDGSEDEGCAGCSCGCC